MDDGTLNDTVSEWGPTLNLWARNGARNPFTGNLTLSGGGGETVSWSKPTSMSRATAKEYLTVSGMPRCGGHTAASNCCTWIGFPGVPQFFHGTGTASAGLETTIEAATAATIASAAIRITRRLNRDLLDDDSPKYGSAGSCGRRRRG